VFENLLKNPVENGGDITVRVGELNDSEGFYVEDNGPGIPYPKKKARRSSSPATRRRKRVRASTSR